MSKVWLITGAARGLGAEIAKAALADGDRVVATGRKVAQIEKAFAGEGDRVLPLTLDVTSESQAVAAVKAALERLGRIDVLVNNAGYGLLGMFEESTPEEIERQYATNVFGLMHVTRAVLPVMRRQRSGHIFNISSVGGQVSAAGGSLYCSTKFAVEGFSEGLAGEVSPFGIHLTIVEPGYFRTDFLDGSSIRYGSKSVDDYDTSSDAVRKFFEGRNHQQAGDPAKLAAALVTLASVEKPPLRWVAGSDAVESIEGKVSSLIGEMDQWRELSLSTDLVTEARPALEPLDRVPLPHGGRHVAGAR
jgi:NAD(P)-dependent dehydrogenase (short-subunit alcohol dehydrogenase family)